MNINANLMVTGHPKAIASKLCRYNAKPAEHVNHGRDDFLRQLADHHQNLGIEGRADSPIRELDENGEIIEDDDTKIDWQSLACPKCHRSVLDTEQLLKHLIESHAKPQEKMWFKTFNTIGKDVLRMMNEAVDTQASCSYVKKKFENSNDMLICSVDSPLFPFLMARHLQVYLRELPQGMTDGICLKMLSAGTTFTVIFVFGKVVSTRRKIKRTHEVKVQNKKLLELEKLCARSWVPEDDIVFKSCRTSDETLALAEALELQWPYSNEDIVNRVNEMRAKREEINSSSSNVYANTVKSDGQIMTSEEKKLISSLATNFMNPLASKRKTTFKNPSELVPKKKRKSDEPASA